MNWFKQTKMKDILDYLDYLEDKQLFKDEIH